MPVIEIIGSIKIYMYFFDHAPPHFHAKYAEHEELIIIETLETYSGSIPKKQRKKVIEWAKNNKAYLNQKWNELNP
ncbi:MAG: hypothetical protein ACI85O_000115 [Saprospiraceae bacterium]|jgi:hypothetical protein